MDNKEAQKLTIEHDIKERMIIISNYVTYNVIDRDDAISKIKSLRITQ